MMAHQICASRLESQQLTDALELHLWHIEILYTYSNGF